MEHSAQLVKPVGPPTRKEDRLSCKLEDLYDDFRSKLKAFVASRTHDERLADDLVQETFLKVTRHCRSGGDCAHPKSFLYTVTTNVIADHFRAAKLQMSHPTLQANHGKDEVDLNGLPQEKTDVWNEHFLECLISLIDSLPEPYREAVRLADIEQVPQQQVAQRMKISLSGAKSRIQRGRLKLRDTILALCSIEHDCYGNITSCEPRR